MLTYEMRPRRRLTAEPPSRFEERGLPPAQLVVEGVALYGNAARLAHEADELVDLLLGLGDRTGGVEDRLAHDGALDVVRAEMEAHGRERHAHHDPVRLDVLDVVEQQARDGEHLQVVRACRVTPATTLEDGV